MRLEVQMRGTSATAGLRILRQVAKRMLKGEVGMRIETWYTAMKDEVRRAEVKAMRSELEQQAAAIKNAL